MTDTELRSELACLERAVCAVVNDVHVTPSGLRRIIVSMRDIARLSLILTHEVIDRVMRLEATR